MRPTRPQHHLFPWPSFEIQLERWYRRLVFRRLKQLGKDSFVSPFARLMNMDRLSIGNDSYVSRGTLLLCVVDYKGEKHDPHLVIGNNVYIGNRCSVSCCNEVVFGDDVTVGDHVYMPMASTVMKTSRAAWRRSLWCGDRCGLAAWRGSDTEVSSPASWRLGSTQ